jgi:spore germination protein YaaH
VSWRASTVARGRVAGYRVRRDGAVIAQVAAERLVVDNLAPSMDVSFTVEAVDTAGTTSPQSARVFARTADPTPTSGRAHAFLLASTGRSFEDFRAHYQRVGTVYPTYFDCDGAGALVGRDDPLATAWAQARKVAVLPRVNCQRTATLHQILTDPRRRRQWIDEIQGLVLRHGYDGVALDFEAGPAGDRDAYTAFVAELAGALHPSGRRLTVVVSPKIRDEPTHPRSGLMDYPALARHADHLFVMAWGLHWSTSEPGPIDPLPWVKAVADYAATVPDRSKIVLGTHLYGLDWRGGGAAGPADALEHADVVARLRRYGAVPRHDPDADAMQATYVDAAGAQHELWYPTAATTAARLRVARERGFGAVGFWRLGNEDPATWHDPLLAPGAW